MVWLGSYWGISLQGSSSDKEYEGTLGGIALLDNKEDMVSRDIRVDKAPPNSRMDMEWSDSWVGISGPDNKLDTG